MTTLADESMKKGWSMESEILTADSSCDLSMRTHIQAFCAVYYNNFVSQTTESTSIITESSTTTERSEPTSTTESSPTTEASRPAAAVDCKLPFVYIGPLFLSNTSALVETVLKVNIFNFVLNYTLYFHLFTI